MNEIKRTETYTFRLTDRLDPLTDMVNYAEEEL